MILSLSMPRVGAQMLHGSIHKLIATAGAELRPGTPLLEVRVDLGSSKAQDCPPLFFFRIIATERAYLRKLDIALGAQVEVGGTLAIATTLAEESFAGTATRALRITSVAIQIDPLSR